jgi:cobaltochelatase CobT
MSGKIDSLKEKFRLALTSTAKVISDDFELINKSSEKDKKKELNTIEIDNLTKPSDFIKLRAETDSSALKKNFLMKMFIKKIFLPILHQDRFIILLKK